MATTAAIRKYTTLDSNGKEIIYWHALGECGHITLYTIPCPVGDWIFCNRCNGASEIKVAKFTRTEKFLKEFGGELVT